MIRKDYNYRDYLDHKNPITAALMARMNFGNDSKALVKAEALNKLKKYNLSPLQKETLANFIEKLLFLNDEEKKEFKELIEDMSLEMISRLTGLSIEELKKLKEEDL